MFDVCAEMANEKRFTEEQAKRKCSLDKTRQTLKTILSRGEILNMSSASLSRLS